MLIFSSLPMACVLADLRAVGVQRGELHLQAGGLELNILAMFPLVTYRTGDDHALHLARSILQVCNASFSNNCLLQTLTSPRVVKEADLTCICALASNQAGCDQMQRFCVIFL